ncbi:hypothetical protein [Bacillus haynesii]|uniref:hypothetical protein n=1 Tax=Bacillus haynesii TaxID=1925021 RepID=UPI0022818E5D|nr:hypothetical protein [Bacillus haynesii]MCY8094034.1 hypothetical protein [Bacillus haynesii]MCY8293356.1 hypothetical protein [Bacillus haynesii]MCY8407259.1 hypothetical protein [Bacillus haynesii]MCY8433928.1 hypothetical protein [Bacillus haynesii]MCY8627408.1 hypothetical protein [Bacillus haynesii]
MNGKTFFSFLKHADELFSGWDFSLSFKRSKRSATNPASNSPSPPDRSTKSTRNTQKCSTTKPS